MKICGGESSKVSIAGKLNINNKILEIEQAKFKKLIGIPISSSEIKKILHSLGFETKTKKK